MEKTIESASGVLRGGNALKRSSNFELLRIVCMLFIILHHFSVHTVLPSEAPEINLIIMKICAIGGKIGVNSYVLISGYFLINSKFKLSKLIKIIAEVVFYSLLIYGILCLTGEVEFSWQGLANQAFPIIKEQYWFMTAYVVTYALSPFINKALKSLSNKEYLVLLALLIAFQWNLPFFNLGNYLGNAGWFITIYAIAGYIRLYPHKIFNSKLIINLTFFITLTLIIIFAIFGVSLWELKSPICVLNSISLFCIFKNLNLKDSKFINLISSATLGVYLIHDNAFIRPLLWNEILLVPKHMNFTTFILFAIVSLVVVFIACTLIDLHRSLIENLIVKAIKKRRK